MVNESGLVLAVVLLLFFAGPTSIEERMIFVGGDSVNESSIGAGSVVGKTAIIFSLLCGY